MRISHLVVAEYPTEEDHGYMIVAAHELLASVLTGMPSHMVRLARDAAEDYLQDLDVVSFWLMALVSVQARPEGEAVATTLLRKDLEEIYMTMMYGREGVV